MPITFVSGVWETMRATPQHTYQILTKRPGMMMSYLRRISPEPLPNVWLGTSVEDQKRAQLRIPKLLEAPAATRFLSCEPLLGPLDLRPWLRGLDWVIVGGESGRGARPMDLRWAREIVSQSARADVSCFVKQLGSIWARDASSSGSKGGEIEDWPRDLRVREMPDQSRRNDLLAVNSVD